ncbi:MAG: hypothetical protein JJU36_00260 [Phycisphaeraceae bacterium]|nr:hypothetical protein [Phycisphaeraceae bacterium]
MRWIWIDRVIQLEAGRLCVATRNTTFAEPYFHANAAMGIDGDAPPLMPHPFIIEGMAQTAGILVGHAGDFKENVILAKIARATFHGTMPPGFTLRFEATLERFDRAGASTKGRVERIDPAGLEPAFLLAEIDLLFSHIDHARQKIDLPEQPFVFSGALMELIVRTRDAKPIA